MKTAASVLIMFLHLVCSSLKSQSLEGDGIDRFNGSTAFSIPLTDQIRLQYSGTVVPKMIAAENRDAQTSWVGAGWTLEFGAVEADLKGTKTIDDDEWTLVLPGGGKSRLMKDSVGILRPQSNPYWKVALTKSGDLVTGVTLTKDDGSKLEFGDFQAGIGSKQANRAVYYWGSRVPDLFAGTGVGQIVYRWDLSRIKDYLGNTLFEFYYMQEKVTINFSGTNKDHTRASYVDSVVNVRTGQKTVFVRGNRSSNEYQNPASSTFKIQRYETKYLDSIKIFAAGWGSSVIRAWDFGYDTIGTTSRTKRLLTSVKQIGEGGLSLPALKLSYDASKSYLLSWAQSPSGDSTKISYSEVSTSYFDAAGGPTTNVITTSTEATNRYVAAHSPTVIASYDRVGKDLTIKKWVGDWKSSSFFLYVSPEAGDSVSLQVNDDHVLIAYSRDDNLKRRYELYGWRDDTQTWNLVLGENSSDFNASYDTLAVALSPNGSYLVLMAGKATNNNSLRIREWDPSRREWSSATALTGITKFPIQTFQVSNEIALFDDPSGCYLFTWEKTGSAISINSMATLVTTADYLNQVYSVHRNYIGHWNRTSKELKACNISFNASTSKIEVGTGQYAQSLRSFAGYSTTSPDFGDERVAIGEYFHADSVRLHTWRFSGASFDTCSTLTERVIWNGTYDVIVKVNNDWLFALNYRHEYAASPQYDSRLFGYPWQPGNFIYDKAQRDTFTYVPSLDPYVYIPFRVAGLYLTDNYVAVHAADTTWNYESYAFLDAFVLDRTSPSTWRSTKTVISEGPYYELNQGLAESNFLGDHAPTSQTTKVKFVHGATPTWSLSINNYRVVRMSRYDAMGGVLERHLVYDSSPTFDQGLSAPGFGWVKDSIVSSGVTKTTFKKALTSEPRLRGFISKSESFSHATGNLVQESTPSWTVYADPSKWYLYQVRKSSVNSVLEGLPRTVYFSYDNVNGRPERIFEDLNVPTEDVGFRDRITDFTYANSQYDTLRAANMLDRVYESSSYSAQDSMQITADAYSSPSMSFQVNTPQTIRYSVNVAYTGSYFLIGTSPGGSEIRNITSDEDAEFVVQEPRTIFLTAYVDLEDPHGGKISNGTMYFTPTELIGRSRTEYVANSKQLSRSQSYDGTSWITTDTILSVDSYGNVLQRRNVDNTLISSKFVFNSTVPSASAIGAYANEVYSFGFDEQSLSGWTITNNDGVDTRWYLDQGRLVQVDSAAASSQENDNIRYHINYDLAGEIVVEWDLKIADSDNWDLYIGIGGASFSGSYDSDCAVWTAFNNETWQRYSTSWGQIQSGFVVGRTYHLKIVANTSTAKSDFYVDGVRVLAGQNFYSGSVGSIQRIAFGNYGWGTTTTSWEIDNLRIYPSYATVTSTSYDYKSLSISSTTDANGTTSFVEYDAFGRIKKARNQDRKTTSEHYYHNSRAENEDIFDPSSPNATTSVSYPQGRELNGLVASWRLDDTSADEVGGYQLTWVGATAVTGMIEKGMDFVGTKSRLGYDTSSSRYSVQYPTVEAWIRLHSTSASQTIACMDVQGSWIDGRGYVLDVSNGYPRFFVGNHSGSWKIATSSSTIPLEEWTHVAGTFDGTYVRVFVNGLEKGSYNTGGISISYEPYASNRGPNPSTFYIGLNHNANFSGPADTAHLASIMNGIIDEVKVYNRALSSAEIQRQYALNIATTFTDGLGRAVQTQSRAGGKNLVSAVKLDKFGRIIRSYRPFAWNTGNQFDSSDSLHAAAVLGVQRAYSEHFYYSDPLGRDSLIKTVNQQSSDEEVKFLYGSQSLNGIPLRYAERQIKYSDLLARVANRTYFDVLGRTIQTRDNDASGETDTILAQTAYNINGLPSFQVAPKGDTTRNQFDFLGRVIQSKSVDGGTSHFAYDNAGRLRFMVDSTGSEASPDNVLYWKYDALGRVYETGYISGPNWSDSFYSAKAATEPTYPSTPNTWRLKYVYDTSSVYTYTKGRLVSMLTNSDGDANAEGEEYYSYDKSGNVKSKTVKVADYTSSTFTTTYTYDLVGRIIEEQYPQSAVATITVTRSYDMLGRPAQIGQLTGNPFANYAYDSLGQLSTEVLNPAVAGGMTRVLSYNKQGLLSSISNSLFSETLRSDSGYTSGEDFFHGLYGKNRTNYGFPSPPGQQSYAFKYDKFGRLIRADNDANNAWDVGVSKHTVYDKNGNIDTLQKGVTTAKKYTYYSQTNRLQNTDGAGNDLTYDRTGNVSHYLQNDILYDPFTMMPQWIGFASDFNTTFQYDGLKERVLKSDNLAGDITLTMYVRGLEAYPLMNKIDVSGLERVYVYGPTGLIAYREGSSWFYVHKDHLGSVRLTATASNTKDDYYDYDPYGRTIRSSVSGNSSMYLFTGQELDVETGLYNFRARMYDTSTGLFYAVDPRRETHSPYGYARNNPTIFTDPNGKETEATQGGRWVFRSDPSESFWGNEGDFINASGGIWSVESDWGMTEEDTRRYRIVRNGGEVKIDVGPGCVLTWSLQGGRVLRGLITDNARLRAMAFVYFGDYGLVGRRGLKSLEIATSSNITTKDVRLAKDGILLGQNPSGEWFPIGGYELKGDIRISPDVWDYRNIDFGTLYMTLGHELLHVQYGDSPFGAHGTIEDWAIRVRDTNGWYNARLQWRTEDGNRDPNQFVVPIGFPTGFDPVTQISIREEW